MSDERKVVVHHQLHARMARAGVGSDHTVRQPVLEDMADRTPRVAIWDAQTLITERLIDYIRATIVHAGGITHVRRIADLAALHNVRTGFHGASDLSPVTMGAALHFGRWIPSFGIQEYATHPAEAADVFQWDWRYAGGDLLSGESPGHGVTIDERAAARFPYQRRYLDVNRLRDGTMWDW